MVTKPPFWFLGYSLTISFSPFLIEKWVIFIVTFWQNLWIIIVKFFAIYRQIFVNCRQSLFEKKISRLFVNV